jgi:putative solute:sodium symporter small subunit
MQAQGRLQADIPTDAAPAPSPRASDTEPAPARHWRYTRLLTAVLLLVWFAASFVTVFYAAELRQRFFGWPLGFWIASQGALLVFLLVVVVYAWAMGRIDAATGLEEER